MLVATQPAAEETGSDSELPAGRVGAEGLVATAPGEPGSAIEPPSLDEARSPELLPPKLSLNCSEPEAEPGSGGELPLGRVGAEGLVATAPGEPGSAIEPPSLDEARSPELLPPKLSLNCSEPEAEPGSGGELPLGRVGAEGLVATVPGSPGLAIESLSLAESVDGEKLPPKRSLICLVIFEASDNNPGTPVGRGGAEGLVATASGDVGLASEVSSLGGAADSVVGSLRRSLSCPTSESVSSGWELLSGRGGAELLMATGSGGDRAGSEGSRTGSEGGVTTGLRSLVGSVGGSTEVGAGDVTGL